MKHVFVTDKKYRGGAFFLIFFHLVALYLAPESWRLVLGWFLVFLTVAIVAYFKLKR